MFDENTPRSLREQILLQHMSDVLSDTERARLMGLPEGCRIRERAKILCPEKLQLGKNVWIGEGAMLDAQGGLSIGDNTQIGLNAMIWSHTSHLQAISGKTSSPSKEGISYLPTRIGRNCFIGGPSVIAPGVTIGDEVIISPLTFVDHDVADGEVVSQHLDMKQLTQKVKRLEETMKKLQAELAKLSSQQS